MTILVFGGSGDLGREVEIMTAIAEGLTNGEIAERFTLADATVKTYVGRILRKLGLRDRVQVVILACDTGLTVPDGRHTAPGGT